MRHDPSVFDQRTSRLLSSIPLLVGAGKGAHSFVVKKVDLLPVIGAVLIIPTSSCWRYDNVLLNMLIFFEIITFLLVLL